MVTSHVYRRPEYQVPVCEIRRVVPCHALMVGLVERSPSEAGQNPVQSPGEVVTAVVLHRQPDVEQMKEDLADGVAAHHRGAPHGQDLLRDQLHYTGVQSRQSEGVCGGVVRQMEDLEEPGDSEETEKKYCLKRKVSHLIGL